MQSTILREKRSNTDLGIVSELIKLMKPRVMSLVIFTCAVGLLTAPNSIPFTQAAIGILIVAIGAGAAGALNMWYEADLDKLMTRTCLRPIPRGKLNRAQALYFGTTLSIISVFSLYYFANAISAFLLFFTIFFYLFIYTIWLKPRTPQNIVIGGAAGAFPPMIGWAAVTGDITLYPILLFAIIFVWTPPHFWALALFANEDYKRANIPMMPVMKGEHYTKIQMLVYTIILFPITLAPWLMGFAGMIYGVSAIVLSGVFIITALLTLCDKTYKSAKQMFGYSVFHLFALFGALIADSVLP